MLWTLESAWALGRIRNESDVGLRLFACWCARACQKIIAVHPSAERVVDVAEAFAQGRASAREFDFARSDASTGAAGAVRALSSHVPTASAHLCCYTTASRIALEAACSASQHHLDLAVDLAAQEGAQKLNWRGDIPAFLGTSAPTVAALQQAILSGQARALRECVGNPFKGKLPINRRPRDETGVPLCPDIASFAPDQLYDIPVSETPRTELPQNREPEVQRISKLLVEYYGWRIPEHGLESAHADFMSAKRALLQASDFDPALDAASVRAYELAEALLFRGARSSRVLQ